MTASIEQLQKEIQYLREMLRITEESRTHSLNCQSELQLMLDQERCANGNKDRSIPMPRRTTMEKKSVVAKFKVKTIQKHEVTLSAVTSGGLENNEFFKYTPSGTLTMHIDNPDALAVFAEVGQEFYLTLTPAE